MALLACAGPAALPASGAEATVPPAASVFQTGAQVAPGVVMAGKPATITVAVTSQSAAKSLVDVEAYNATGAKIFQQWFDNQTFAAGQRREYAVTWQLPDSLPRGIYTVKVGVYGAGWNGVYDWNNDAAQFVTIVPRPASPQLGPTVPMSIISRNVPAYASEHQEDAHLANDSDYDSNWRGYSVPAWLAYDLSGVPAAKRGRVVVVYYNGSYDYARPPHYNNLGAYTVEANAAPGGGPAPATGWVALASVTGNTYHSRQHVVDLTGYNWVRLYITASDGSSLNDGASFNLDVHTADAAVSDDWIFYGDSITAAGMVTYSVEGVQPFAKLVNTAAPAFFPIAENGGIPGARSDDGAAGIRTWLGVFPGRYVALSYGTNDAGYGSGNPPALAANFYSNYAIMVEAVLAAGKIPVVPKIPWSRAANVQTFGPLLNSKIDELYNAYPEVIRGPDLWSFFESHQNLISNDNLHPTSEGFSAYRQLWAQSAIAAVYTPAAAQLAPAPAPPAPPPPAPVTVPAAPSEPPDASPQTAAPPDPAQETADAASAAAGDVNPADSSSTDAVDQPSSPEAAGEALQQATP